MAPVQEQTAERARKILDTLLRDNATYVSGDSPSQAILSPASLRHDLADNGQTPVAAIVACADSRVAPEIVFCAPIGHLFVIRNAGNIPDQQDVLASLQYAIHFLNVPLVIVLGHSKCGAVTAGVGAAKSDAPPPAEPSPLESYVSIIADIVKGDVGKPEEVKDAILTNIRAGVSMLKEPRSPISEAYNKGDIDIVGALYDIHKGEVFVIDM